MKAKGPCGGGVVPALALQGVKDVLPLALRPEILEAEGRRGLQAEDWPPGRARE